MRLWWPQLALRPCWVIQQWLCTQTTHGEGHNHTPDTLFVVAADRAGLTLAYGAHLSADMLSAARGSPGAAFGMYLSKTANDNSMFVCVRSAHVREC